MRGTMRHRSASRRHKHARTGTVWTYSIRFGRLSAMSQRAFRCQVCGSGFFRAVLVPRPDGSLYATSFYECTGCSVVFIDPHAFNANEPGPPQSRGAKLPVAAPNTSRNGVARPLVPTPRRDAASDGGVSTQQLPEPSPQQDRTSE